MAGVDLQAAVDSGLDELEAILTLLFISLVVLVLTWPLLRRVMIEINQTATPVMGRVLYDQLTYL